MFKNWNTGLLSRLQSCLSHLLLRRVRLTILRVLFPSVQQSWHFGCHLDKYLTRSKSLTIVWPQQKGLRCHRHRACILWMDRGSLDYPLTHWEDVQEACSKPARTAHCPEALFEAFILTLQACFEEVTWSSWLAWWLGKGRGGQGAAVFQFLFH